MCTPPVVSDFLALSAEPPIVIVDAACSKHRKREVLPLHPEVVAMLREWLPQVEPQGLLFPKLERKKTWFMVKRDLESVEILYETDEGFADFHAAGRHSHITGLLQSGATLTQARELARHRDTRMTMRYTHIGIDDQAAALAGLPGPASNATSKASAENQRLSSAQVDSPWQSVSFIVDSGVSVSAKENPCGDKGYLEKSPSDGECHNWRRRESNPQAVSSNHLPATELGNGNSSESVNASQPATGNCDCHAPASYGTSELDASIRYIADRWPYLQPHFRETILAIVDLAAPRHSFEGGRL